MADSVGGGLPLSVSQFELLSSREQPVAVGVVYGNKIQFDFDEIPDVRYYQWRTPKTGGGVDHAGDPVDWRMEGSNDGVAWTLLDVHVGYDCLTNRNFRIGPFGCPPPRQDVLDEIDPFIGSGPTRIYECGFEALTHPGARMPFGMTQVVADHPRRDSSCYVYECPETEGFACMRLEGVGYYGEFGNFLVRPCVDWRNPFREQTISSYSHASEVVEPGFYSVKLDRFGFRVDTTATKHGAMMRFRFPETDKADVSVDLARRVGLRSPICSVSRQRVRKTGPRMIEGVMRCDHRDGGWGKGVGACDYELFYCAEFSEDLVDWRVYDAERNIGRRNEYEGSNVVFSARFKGNPAKPVEMRVAFSFVDAEGARVNFKNDFRGQFDFEGVRQQAIESWREAMGVIELEGGTPNERETFRSCLFFALHDPRDVSDADGRYPVYRYPSGKTVRKGLRFRTVFSGWDVFRSWSPLMTLLRPKDVSDVVNSLMETADIGHRYALPVWDIFNCRSNCMCGNPAIPVILEAWTAGVRTFDAEKALALSEKSLGKFGIPACGFVPNDMSRTLERGYSAWCAGRLAADLGKNETARKLYTISHCYTNLWCREVDWMRSKSADGGWMPWKGLETLWQGTMECNPYQQGWFVPHDPEGLMRLCGGAKAFAERLEVFFGKTPRTYYANRYYSHNNEPVHLVPFLFHHAGRPDLTSKWVRSIATEAYDIGSRGLVGPEDEGQMCAWYCLAAMGLHPTCPGSGIWVLTAPLFDRISIKLDSDYYKGSRFTINVRNNSPRNVFVKAVKLNGRTLDRLWLRSSEITSGGDLELELADAAPVVSWIRPPNPLNEIRSPKKVGEK